MRLNSAILAVAVLVLIIVAVYLISHAAPHIDQFLNPS